MELDSNPDFIITNSHKLLCSFVPQFPLWEWSVFLDEFCLYKKTLLVAIKGSGRETLASNPHLITAAGVFPSWALGKLKQTRNREEVLLRLLKAAFFAHIYIYFFYLFWMEAQASISPSKSVWLLFCSHSATRNHQLFFHEWGPQWAPLQPQWLLRSLLHLLYLTLTFLFSDHFLNSRNSEVVL